jgi:fermentation-respiration switch protein FrsA (DUF1100 family)
VASPDINTDDFSAAIDHIGLLPFVDRNRIGIMAICGLSGMALTAATSDSRIKAVATASMYDMSRSMSRSFNDGYTREQRHKVVDYLSQQRWTDAEKGRFESGYHEVPFDAKGNLLKGNRVLAEKLPADADPVLAAFFDYYRTPRGFHPRSINSHSRYYAEDVYKSASDPKELVIVPDADHLDLYDNLKKIPFDRLDAFFRKNLA